MHGGPRDKAAEVASEALDGRTASAHPQRRAAGTESVLPGGACTLCAAGAALARRPGRGVSQTHRHPDRLPIASGAGRIDLHSEGTARRRHLPPGAPTEVLPNRIRLTRSSGTSQRTAGTSTAGTWNGRYGHGRYVERRYAERPYVPRRYVGRRYADRPYVDHRYVAHSHVNRRYA